jgi:hypothetical protein
MITLAQFNELQSGIQAAQARAASLEAQLQTAYTTDPEGRIEALRDLARDMMQIVRFALANLPPIEIPKWPYEAVARVAEHWSCVPDFTHDDEVLITELRAFAEDVRTRELERAREREALIASAPLGVVEIDPTDQTCLCSDSDPCPLNRTPEAGPCPLKDLIAAGVTCVFNKPKAPEPPPRSCMGHQPMKVAGADPAV